MRRIFLQNFCFHAASGLLLLCPMVYAQSLGDVAREYKEKKAAEAPSTTSKVITNKDLDNEADEDASSTSDTSQTPPEDAGKNAVASRKAAAQRAAEQRAAQQWKQKILAQERVIANLQFRADKLRAWLQAGNAGNPYDGPAFTRYQASQLNRLKETELQLAEQKQALEDMQEAARHAGMHTPVYDP